MGVGLVHDYLLVFRGAERTFASMADLWPGAPIYTLLHDPDEFDGSFDGHPVTTSYLQRLGVRQDGFRRLLPLFPHAAERLPVGDHDVIVSSSSAFAHGVRPAPGAVHICYCHSPFRYVWHERERAFAEVARPLRPLLGLGLQRVRRWDLEASSRVTHYVANSNATRRRIAEFYGRDAIVVHPPVEVERFRPGAPEDFLLVVGEVLRHKRIEVALEAARRANMPIKIVGGGPDLARLRVEYQDSAEFLGRVADRDLPPLYAAARALVVSNIEEFGIAAVEAQAAGRPVVAADAGGARETVIDGVTGVLVPPDDVDALAEALRHTDFDRFDPLSCRANAERFSPGAFSERFSAAVARATGRRQESPLRARRFVPVPARARAG
jgi:glycosyltransferase involved in cell wall biosynthesis